VKRNASSDLFLADVAATGLATIKDVIASSGLHRGTIMKHIAAGHLSVMRRVVRGKPVLLFHPDEVAAYAKKAKALLRNFGYEYRAAEAASGYVTIAKLSAQAGVSKVAVSKHIRKGLLKGKKRKIGGRAVMTVTAADAEKYAQEAKEIIAAATRENHERGPARAPAGYMTLRELAKRSRRTTYDLYKRVGAGEIEASHHRNALIVAIPKAHAFIDKHGLVEPSGGLVSISEAAFSTGLDAATIRYAVKQGHVAAIPARNIAVQSNGKRTGRPQILVSLNDVRAYATSDRQARQTKKLHAELIRIRNTIGRKISL
jgi:hypothetical protein